MRELQRVPDSVSLYVRSMGKALRVTAIALTDDAANAHCARTNDAVVACVGRVVLMADKGDRGE
jgi:hypothetical protein